MKWYQLDVLTHFLLISPELDCSFEVALLYLHTNILQAFCTALPHAKFGVGVYAK